MVISFREKERLFCVMFHLEPRYSRLELRGHMRKKMLTWLGARDDLMSLAYNQVGPILVQEQGLKIFEFDDTQYTQGLTSDYYRGDPGDCP